MAGSAFGVRATHVPGILDRRVGRQHADGHHHAFERKLPAT
jgi:hypothetical protein